MADTKTDNSSVYLKAKVRQWLLQRFDEAHVLDLYCGARGWMWRMIWKDAESYLGVDRFIPHSLATTMRMSAERASQALDLNQYNIFDVNCYSSPWKVARRICRRRDPGRFGMVLTSGEYRGMPNRCLSLSVRTII